MKDFFYNKSDVLVAALIIIIAAAVIYSRVVVIMDYGKSEGVSGILPSLEEAADMVGEGVREAVDSLGAADSAAGPGAADEGGGAPAAVDAVDAGDTGAAPAGEAPSITITINAGDSADAIAGKLLEAGAIADKQAFLAEVSAQGADSRLRMGTFTIPAGATAAEIIGILVG